MKITLKQLKQVIKEEVNKNKRVITEKSHAAVTGAMRQTLNTCSNHVSDFVTFVKTKRPEWTDTLEALRTAEKAIEAAHQTLLNKE